MRSPFSSPHLLLFLLALGFLVAYIQVSVVTLTFSRLGLSREEAIVLLFVSLIGSVINLPLFRIKAEPSGTDLNAKFHGLLRAPRKPFTGKTLIAANVGGCVVPIFFSVYLLRNNPISLGQTGLALGAVAIISYLLSRPIPGLGMGMPFFVAPVTAALVSVLIGGEQSAPLAYVCGTLGVLIGADLMHLNDISKMGAPVASIGGAGTFDGIFLTGIVAVLLA